MDIPIGLCQCGCGQKTRVAAYSNSRYGYVKGQPVRFALGHYAGKRTGRPPKSKVHYVVDGNGCWVWQRSKAKNGYGQLWVDGRLQRAHRHYWTLANGPILDGLHIDHLCCNRACVNAAHMELVTPGENNRRARERRRTHDLPQAA